MSDAAIVAEAVGKRYRLGTDLNANLSRAARAAVRGPSECCAANGERRARHRERTTRDFWALRDVSFELAGEARRHHRPQRRRQEHAAEDPLPDHRADRGARPSARPGRQPARGRDRLPPRADRPREHLPQRRDPRHAPPRDRRAASTRSSSSPGRAVPRHAGQALLERDVRAPRLRRRGPLEPEILLVDEVLAVGDAEFQRKCLGKMGDVAGEGRHVVFVSHNMDAVQRLCSTRPCCSTGAGSSATRARHEVIADVPRTHRPRARRAASRRSTTAPSAAERGGAGCGGVTMRDTPGQPDAPAIYMGEPFSVSAVYEVFEPISSAAFELGIRAVEGDQVLTSQTIDAGGHPIRRSARRSRDLGGGPDNAAPARVRPCDWRSIAPTATPSITSNGRPPSAALNAALDGDRIAIRGRSVHGSVRGPPDWAGTGSEGRMPRDDLACDSLGESSRYARAVASARPMGLRPRKEPPR